MTHAQSKSRLDPAGRSLSFHRRPSNPISQTSQERRRSLALEAQKERRQHAFLTARQGVDNIGEMEDLTLSKGAEEEYSSDDAFSDPSSLQISSSSRSQTSPNATDMTSTPCSPTGSPPTPKISKLKRASFKPKYKPWAKGLLMHAETLDLRHGLPTGLESDWLILAVPKGKRCLCATSQSSPDTPNTVLYSRVSGRTLQKAPTVLPPDCLLDCIFDKQISVLWVLDIIKWTGQFYVECEADFRQFFLASKLSELPIQSYLDPQSMTTDFGSGPLRSPQVPYILLPVPKLLSPLSPSSILQFTASLAETSVIAVTVNLLNSSSSTLPTSIQLILNITGLLIYLKQAHYESGTTTLAGWIPGEVEPGSELETAEGMDRFRSLLSGNGEPSNMET